MTQDIDLFLTLKEDYREALEHCSDALHRLESNPEDWYYLEGACQQLRRIKGFTNRMNAPKLGQLARFLEDVLAAVTAGRFPFDEDLASLFFKGMDLFVHYLRSGKVRYNETAEVEAEIQPLLFGGVEEEGATQDMEPLLPDFIASARDNVDAINRGLSGLEKEPANGEFLQEVYRNAHSLKGSALTMGFKRMGRLAHHMEDVLRALQKGQLLMTHEVCGALFETNDVFSVMLDSLCVSKRMKVDATSRMKGLAKLLRGFQCEEENTGLESVKEAEQARVVTETGADTTPTISAMDTVRVSTAKLDELVNLVSEAFITKNRLANEISALVSICDRWQRLRRQEKVTLRLTETGSENMVRPVSELLEFGNSLDEISRRLQEAAENTGRHIETLQHRSMEIRMLPLARVFDTLPRAVRDISRQFGKQVNFEVEGGETTVDKRILEQISDPLIHILRNALDHGIESPEVRRRFGKLETGTIHLQAKQEGGKVLVTLRDDGRGIDPHRLKEVATARGLVDHNDIAGWTTAQLLKLIFLPGLSTRRLATNTSGRGVGMDVVRANVEGLNGQVKVTSELGKGTHFIMSLPLTLATVHALMIQCSGEMLAIPTVSVVKTLQVSRSEIRPVRGEHAILHQGEILPVRSLAAALGWDEQNGDSWEGGRAMLAVLQAEERRAGFIVDDILGEQEIVARDLDSRLQEIHFVAGATILGTGEVALILDVPQLLGKKHLEGCTGSGP
jgi:two-component system chemotaxis sensor kinase CheA